MSNDCFKVKIFPDGKIIEIKDESLFTALRNANYPIKSSCGGKAVCGDCKVKIIKGEENLEEVKFKEKNLIGNVFYITKERLSCQTFVRGDIEVDISEHLATSDTNLPKAKTILKKSSGGNQRFKNKTDGNEKNNLSSKKGGFNRPKKVF